MFRRRARFVELERNVSALEGRDGWLFLSDDSNDVIGQHTGRVQMAPDWARSWRRLLAQRRRAMSRLGVVWLQFIVPDREAVYADKLPPEIVPAQRRPIHLLREIAAEAGVELLYPLAEFRAERDRGVEVYNDSDTHWNAHGAFLAYELIVAELRKRGVELPAIAAEEVEWRSEEFVGDLGIKLDPVRPGTRVEGPVREPRAKLLEDNEIRVTGRRLEFASDAPGDLGCTVFGTSYAVYCLPYLAESFARLSYLHTTALAGELVRAQRPQVVLVIVSERGLRRSVVDRDAMRMLEQAMARKRAEGIVAPPGELDHVGLPPRSGA